ncbi:MAG: phosphate acetyltransferase [Planctomycetota bacterium]|nr:phosphate acetyltransferase [Planctomycetota bacterium]
MPTILVAPAGRQVGLTSVCLGLVHAFERRGVRVAFVKPIAQPADGTPDRSRALVAAGTHLHPPEPIPRSVADAYLGDNRDQDLMEQVVALCQRAASQADVLIVEGLVPDTGMVHATRVNAMMCKALDAELVLVAAPAGLAPATVVEAARIAANAFALDRQPALIVNRLGDPGRGLLHEPHRVEEEPDIAGLTARYRELATAEGLRLIGGVPHDEDVALPRVSDIADAIGASYVSVGEARRRVRHVALCGMTVPYVLPLLQPATLVIAPAGRDDIVMAAALAAIDGVRLAGLLLAGSADPDERILRLCRPALSTELPVLRTPASAFDTALAIGRANLEIPVDDRERLQATMSTVANALDGAWIEQVAGSKRERRLSPPAFRYQLIERARAANKRIVLPEGTEPRTLKAAAICHEKGIARCVLLGNPDEVRAAAAKAGVKLPASVEIIDHRTLIDEFVPILCELRKHKGLTPDQAREALNDTIMPGTLMVKLGRVDGLVSGAVHTTAHTITPALQIIKCAPGMSLASSCFFMCLPDQVVVFADCAVNPNPSAEQLADIAIQSAESALAFGIPARVAMLSYSTGSSGSGSDVDKVVKATQLAQARRPDLLIDGPLQYDAAAVMDVARTKAPGSKVAGQATVFIFPDLDSGNVAYKAVQRSANAVAIGPMMQGLDMPVNDLSRGCLVDDIVYTIAITAIQAEQAAQRKRRAAASA